MASRTARIDDALQHLLLRLLPPPESASTTPLTEDEEDARFDAALSRARDILDKAEAGNGSGNGNGKEEDVGFVAEGIRGRLVRSRSGTEDARRFEGLYGRLMTQPVLERKGGILRFLEGVGEVGEGVEGAGGRREQQQEEEERETNGGAEERGSHARYERVERERERQYTVDSPAFNEAFSRNGLPRLPRAEGPESTRQPSSRERERDRPSLRPSQLRKEQEQSQDESVDEKIREPVPEAPSEAALLRDLPFTLQGLSSTNLAFSDTTTASLNLPPSLPLPIISLLHTLAEPSLLYRSLAGFVDSNEGGLVGQSLRSAIGVELRAYLGLVATLEGQIRRALKGLDEEGVGQKGLGKAGVTLKRCVVWTREATMGLRLMSLIVEEAKGKKGGELISLIHAFSSTHGDPFVSTFSSRLLEHVTKPFYTMLRHWIYDGELEDPFQEFFVSLNQDNLDLDPRRGGATSVWEDKYKLNESQIPTIITQDFAKKVFLIGKSLNFIRYGCNDSAWVESHSKEQSHDLAYGDTAALESSIDEAYALTMARLIHLMSAKFNLFEHLSALKKYLLLGAGDFIALLMESLSSALDRPANSQYRHTLTAQLEHAIRNSNAQFDSPDVLRRLDARMLELSHGEIGWDVFTLEYRVDSPLDVVVTPWAAKQYLKVFNFLWRVKRVEFALGQTWRRCMTGARGVLAAISEGESAGGGLAKEWKMARGGIAEMVHFVDQLQYYILFEVIEKGWEGLLGEMKKPDATLDTLITAHTSYLLSITRKGLLATSSTSTSDNINFTSQLHELLKLMLAYKDAVDALYSHSVADFTRRQDRAAKISSRTAQGFWGVSERDDDLPTPRSASALNRNNDSDSPIPPLLPLNSSGNSTDDSASVLESLRRRLRGLETEFRARVNVLLGDLAYQPDTDMRFLGVVMNFNDVYAPVRRRRGRERERGRGGQGQGAGESVRA